MKKANIRVDGLFLKADVWFDGDRLCSMLEMKETLPNISLSKHRKDVGNIMVDDMLHAEMFFIERTNAWMNFYRSAHNRLDTTIAILSMELLGFLCRTDK